MRISASGIGDFVRIHGITNVEKYSQVLMNYAIASGKHLIVFSVTMIPKHTTNIIIP